MKEEPNSGAGGADDGDGDGDGGGVIVIKSIEDVDTSAVSPFIVSLPSEEGFYFHFYSLFTLICTQAHTHTLTRIHTFKVYQLKGPNLVCAL